MAIVGVLMSFVIVISLQVPGLIQKKLWRELAAFSVLLIIGMAISIPQTLGMKVPSPNDLIIMIFKPFAEWLKQ